jgi:hypothetical protein
MKRAGFTRGEVKAVLAEKAARPLRALGPIIEAKDVTAEAKALPSGEPPSKKKKADDDKQ